MSWLVVQEALCVLRRICCERSGITQPSDPMALSPYEIAQEALDFFKIDELGLDDNDRAYLRTMIEKFRGRAGLKAMAVAVSEDERTIEEVYEPYLN